MSQVRDAVQRGNPRDVKRVLNLRGEDVGTDTAAFGGILSATEDNVQKALDAIDDIFAGDITFTGNNISFTGSVSVVSTADDANTNPIFQLYRNSPSPAANDAIGEIAFYGEDSVGNKDQFAGIHGRIIDPTSTSEDGQLTFRTAIAGTLGNRFRLGNGLFSANATGGDQGADTINASTIYDDGVQIKPVTVFRSSGSGITANATHTFAHSLGAEPDTVVVILQCTTIDNNWAVGDRIVISTAQEPATVNENGVIVQIDSTNVTVYVADEIQAFDKSTFEGINLTLGSWDMYVKAAYFN